MTEFTGKSDTNVIVDGCVTYVETGDTDTVARGFGADPAEPLVLSLDDALRTLDDHSRDHYVALRRGPDWTAAMELGALRLASTHPPYATRPHLLLPVRAWLRKTTGPWTHDPAGSWPEDPARRWPRRHVLARTDAPIARALAFGVRGALRDVTALVAERAVRAAEPSGATVAAALEAIVAGEPERVDRGALATAVLELRRRTTERATRAARAVLAATVPDPLGAAVGAVDFGLRAVTDPDRLRDDIFAALGAPFVGRPPQQTDHHRRPHAAPILISAG